MYWKNNYIIYVRHLYYTKIIRLCENRNPFTNQTFHYLNNNIWWNRLKDMYWVQTNWVWLSRWRACVLWLMIYIKKSFWSRRVKKMTSNLCVQIWELKRSVVFERNSEGEVKIPL